METRNQTTFVAFASQKGGVGKSTFTSLIASILHYRKGFNVAVIDCDFPQYSLAQMRERDLKAVMQNETFKKMAHRQFANLGRMAYPVLKERPDSALEAAYRVINSSDVKTDVVFFDLPGTVNTAGIIKALAGMHYVFIPITADRLVMESALVFTQLMTDVLMQQQNVDLKDINLFWNQVDARERSPIYATYTKLIQELKIKLMHTSIASSVRFRKEAEADARNIFRSTLLPADQGLLQGCNLELFLEEFLKILKL